MVRGLILLCWLVASAAWAQEKYPFKVDVQKDRQGATFWGRNDGPAPVSVLLRFPVQENLKSDAPLPVLAVVPARSSKKMVRLSRLDERAAWRYESSWRWQPGDYTAKPDPDARYRVPWSDGRSFTIGQAPGGRITTHDNAWSRNAVDINMPEGTPVLAARAGIVMQVEEGFRGHGTDPRYADRANYVRVLHDDGSMAVYAHLAPASMLRMPGDHVVAGQMVGKSGNTGFSTGPHLHFCIQRNAGMSLVSIPFSVAGVDPTAARD